MAVRMAWETVVLFTPRSERALRLTVARISGCPAWLPLLISTIPGTRRRTPSYWSASWLRTAGSGPTMRMLTLLPPPPRAPGRLVVRETSGRSSSRRRISLWMSHTERVRCSLSSSSMAMFAERPPPRSPRPRPR